MTYLSVIKGRDGGETTRMVLAALLSRPLQSNMNWAGINRCGKPNQKFGIKTLSNVCSMIMRKCYLFNLVPILISYFIKV